MMISLVEINCILAAVIWFGLVSAQTQCNIVSVQVCFTQMRERLGIDDNQIGSDLFNLMNPGNAGTEQAQTCTALEDYNLSTVKTCIGNASCTDTSILPPELANQPGVPLLTWGSIIDLFEGMCKPGCEGLSNKNAEVENCNLQVAGGSGGCGDLEKLFKCFRSVIGSCEVMVTFTESLLESTGVIKTVHDKCPDVNLSLSGSMNLVGSYTSTLILAACSVFWIYLHY